MTLFEHMRPLSDGPPSWLDRSHFANVRQAAAEIKARTGLDCWFDCRGKRVFFGRTSPDGLIGWLFEHPLFHPDKTPIRFGAADRDMRVDDVCQIVGYANAPQAVKERWEAQRKWCEESEQKSAQDKRMHDPHRLKEVEKATERFFERLAMGKHYRPSVLVG